MVPVVTAATFVTNGSLYHRTGNDRPALRAQWRFCGGGRTTGISRRVLHSQLHNAVNVGDVAIIQCQRHRQILPRPPVPPCQQRRITGAGPSPSRKSFTQTDLPLQPRKSARRVRPEQPVESLRPARATHLASSHRAAFACRYSLLYAHQPTLCPPLIHHVCGQAAHCGQNWRWSVGCRDWLRCELVGRGGRGGGTAQTGAAAIVRATSGVLTFSAGLDRSRAVAAGIRRADGRSDHQRHYRGCEATDASRRQCSGNCAPKTGLHASTANPGSTCEVVRTLATAGRLAGDRLGRNAANQPTAIKSAASGEQGTRPRIAEPNSRHELAAAGSGARSRDKFRAGTSRAHGSVHVDVGRIGNCKIGNCRTAGPWRASAAGDAAKSSCRRPRTVCPATAVGSRGGNAGARWASGVHAKPADRRRPIGTVAATDDEER